METLPREREAGTDKVYTGSSITHEGSDDGSKQKVLPV